MNGVNRAVRVSNGGNGGIYIGGTSATSGSWSAVQVIADAKFHTLTGNITGVANTTLGSAPTMPAGVVLFGGFTTVQLHSGSVIAYNV